MENYKIIISIIIGLCFLYLSCENVDIDSVVNIFKLIEYKYIIASIGVYFFEIYFRSLRWQMLIKKIKPSTELGTVLKIYVMGYAMNSILPAKLGELYRAHLLGKKENMARFSIMGTIIVERLFDLLFVVLLLCYGLTQIDGVFEQYSDIIGAISKVLVFVVIVVVLLLVSLFFKKASAVSLKNKFSIRLGHFLSGVDSIINISYLLRMLAFTFCIWSINAFAIWLLLSAFHVQFDFFQMILLLGMSGVAASIPSAPASLGTLQYAFYLTFSLLHFSSDSALISSLAVQVFLMGTITLIGCVFLMKDFYFRRSVNEKPQ